MKRVSDSLSNSWLGLVINVSIFNLTTFYLNIRKKIEIDETIVRAISNGS